MFSTPTNLQRISTCMMQELCALKMARVRQTRMHVAICVHATRHYEANIGTEIHLQSGNIYMEHI